MPPDGSSPPLGAAFPEKADSHMESQRRTWIASAEVTRVTGLWAVQAARLYSYAAPWPTDVAAALVTSTGDSEPIRASMSQFALRLGRQCQGHCTLTGGHFALLEQWDQTAPLIVRHFDACSRLGHDVESIMRNSSATGRRSCT
jgi:hypothetical protein